MLLAGKRILLGITGSIAAYKTANLVRLLKKSGAEVQVIATPSALAFVTPLTLATLSERPVYSDFIKNEQGEWVNHVALALWADLMIIAPASANTLSKMAQAGCDNLLLATYLSAKCPVFFAPAMDLDMYQHPANRANIDKLIGFGHHFIAPGIGPLASGLSGEGRMAEPEAIFDQLLAYFNKSNLLGKNVLITAGPTYEAIDPVRFIGNRSSGKMGYALARALVLAGAEVHLISGPTALEQPAGLASFTRIETADELFKACQKLYKSAEITIMAAAVADYRPENTANQKIKKNDQSLHIQLSPTTDILGWMGENKAANQYLVGFALETDQEEKNALAKRARKNLDLIVLNSLKDEGAGFGHDTNVVYLYNHREEKTTISLRSKDEIASEIVQYLHAALA
jgi:phosphopantothenoylcysteine decarboxylase/phosphopantothenate--cysteine ligase